MKLVYLPPPLDLNEYSDFNIWLRKYFLDNNNESAQIRIYSDGTDYDTNLEKTYDIPGSGGSYTYGTGDIDIANFTNKSQVYIEFFYKYSGENEDCSLNIDCIKLSTEGIIFFYEDFEDLWIENEYGDIVPDVNWTQKKYNQTIGNWTQEYYHMDVDLLGEVFVGRAPVGDSTEVSNFVIKTIDYENTYPRHWYTRKVLLVSGRLEFAQWGNPYCDIVSENIPEKYKIKKKLYDNMTLLGGIHYYTHYSRGQLRRSLNSNFHIIYGEDHGFYDKIIRYIFPLGKKILWPIPRFCNKDVYLLYNLKPFFMYSHSCLVGAFDEEDCLAEYLTVKTKHGAFAVLMYSRESIGSNVADDDVVKYFPAWFFNITFFREKYELGKANQLSKHVADDEIKNERNSHEVRMDVYGRNLFGDPTVALKLPNNNQAPDTPEEKDITYDKLSNGWYLFNVSTTDPENDKIQYKFKINDIPLLRWTHFYNSGDIASKKLWLPSGTYNISVKARDIFLNKSGWSEPKKVTVSFNSNIQTDTSPVVLGNEVQFTGIALGGSEPYTPWYYDFGDGNNSQQQNPSHIYGSLGNYTVTLNVNDNQNISSNISKVISVVILDADFESFPGIAVSDQQETFYFNDKSKGYYNIVNWSWDFGDGNYSQQQNTSHTYSALGSYNVTMSVIDSQNITSNLTKVINVVLINADFKSSPGRAVSNQEETFYFNDKSNGYYDIVNWSWDFGDGNISFQRNTSHVYSSEGAYNVSLTVTDNESNNDTFYQMIYIDSVSPTISSAFSNSEVIGYGSNVTISVNTSDNSCGVKSVRVNITYPDCSYVNYTMNNTNGSIFEYDFSDCWQFGEYSYIVWVVDQANNSNYVSGNSFVVSRGFGYKGIGGANQTIRNTITGSRFMVYEKGVADNISVYMDSGINVTSDSHYQCMIYRHNDSYLIGISEQKNVSIGKGWQIFNFSVPKPVLLNDTEYALCCWSDDNYSVAMYYDNGTGSEMYYDDGTSTLQGHYFEGIYGYPPDINNFKHEDRKYSIYCCYTPDNTSPEITNVSDTLDPAGFGLNVTISADIIEYQSGVDIIKVNITYPNSTEYSFDMNYTGNNTYQFVFNDTWVKGQYSYLIWTSDFMNNTNISTGYSFTVSGQATISVCTIQDEYSNNETVNLTDPPETGLIGYDLLDDGKVLHIWNKFDNYYFNTSSGIQLTNHYSDYWSHNVLMLGYYSNDQWNLIYRTDELSGFNKIIDCDNETFVNVTLWKDLSYGGYAFRLAIRYYLGVDDNELTVIPYIKNLGEAIPYVLGFGWEMKDIQINMTETGDYINVNRTIYYLNQTLDNVYTDLSEPVFYLMENITDTSTRSLYLRWNQSLQYKLRVKSRDGQYNAPVTLFIKIGTLNEDQEKYIELFWYDAEQVTYYFDSFDENPYCEAWATTPGYMVDGSISNWASTTINGDVELCDENNCSGDDFGTISKVELRVRSYYSGGQRDTILRPVYGGTNDGMEYRYSTGPSIMWSEWFDITYGPYAPQPWGWNDIVSLDCDVVAENDPIGPPFTLYCSKVELRVKYTPSNYDPIVSSPVPADGATGVSIQPVFNITVSDPDGDTMNITWLSNSSGSWQVFGTNNSAGNGTYHQTFSNASVNGQWWYWKVNVSNGVEYVESGVYKFYTGCQSKIMNTGSTDIKGYLLIQVQYYNTTSSTWVLEQEVLNETTPRTINGSDVLALDTIFNPYNVSTSSFTNGDGTYRIYVAFRNHDGNILVTDNETELMATYEFTVTFD